MEIERKFKVKKLPEQLESFRQLEILQGYIFFQPVVRLRKQSGEYYLCVKSDGLMVREEFELPLKEAEFNAMWQKVEARPIEKTRYLIPIENGLVCELDVFKGDLSPLVIAEVEFDSLEAAEKFTPPSWFAEELTSLPEYSNKNLARFGIVEQKPSVN